MIVHRVTAPLRRRFRRGLHGTILRGQATDTTVFQMLARGISKDLDLEVRRARNEAARVRIEAIKADAEKATNQFLINMIAIYNVPLAHGQTPADRIEIGIGEYLMWREQMDAALLSASVLNRRRGT